MTIDSEILEYLKNSYAYINLVIGQGKRKIKNFDQENSSDSSDGEGEGIIARARIKLNDIISNTDYINIDQDVYSLLGNQAIGNINMDIKLENAHSFDSLARQTKVIIYLSN
jgi:hypothetical protein